MRNFLFLLLAAVVLAGIASAGVDCKNGYSNMKTFEDKWSTDKYCNKYLNIYPDRSGSTRNSRITSATTRNLTITSVKIRNSRINSAKIRKLMIRNIRISSI